MKRLLLAALAVPLLFASCDTYAPGYGYTSVGVGYYDSLPSGWSNPYYHYNNRYYYGGNWEVGRFYHGGRYYDGRYRHQGQYIYGGNYYQRPHSHSHQIRPSYPNYPSRPSRPPGRPRPHFPMG